MMAAAIATGPVLAQGDPIEVPVYPRFTEDSLCPHPKYFMAALLREECSGKMLVALAANRNDKPPVIAKSPGGRRFLFGSIEGVWRLVGVGPFWRDELDEDALDDMLDAFLVIEASDEKGVLAGDGDNMRRFQLREPRKPSELGYYQYRKPNRNRTPMAVHVQEDGREFTLGFYRCEPSRSETENWKRDCLILDTANRLPGRFDLGVYFDRLIYQRDADPAQ